MRPEEAAELVDAVDNPVVPLHTWYCVGCGVERHPDVEPGVPCPECGAAALTTRRRTAAGLGG